MAGSILTEDSCKELTGLFEQLARAAADTVVSLIGREIAVTAIESKIIDDQTLIASLGKSYALARGGLEKDFADKSLTLLLDVGDAIAMSGMLMMTPDDVIQQRRVKGVIEGEDAEAFGEVAGVLFTGIGTVLRDQVPNIDIKLSKHGPFRPKQDDPGAIGKGVLVVHTFEFKVGDLEATKAHLITDVGTAEAWNKGPLRQASATAAGEPAAGASKSDDDGFDGIPAAPIRGVLAAFVAQPEVYRTLRQSCRRVGLDLQRHGKSEIPNPAAHRDQILLLDIPAGEDRQFDWCKRIKDFGANTKVVLLLHHPSRSRVTQAFLAKADAILGLPCDEPKLSQKLASMLEAAQPVEPKPE